MGLPSVSIHPGLEGQESERKVEPREEKDARSVCVFESAQAMQVKVIQSLVSRRLSPIMFTCIKFLPVGGITWALSVSACVCWSPGPALSTFLGGSRVARLAPHKQEKEIAGVNYGYLPKNPRSVCVFKYGALWLCGGKQQKICLLRTRSLVLGPW